MPTSKPSKLCVECSGPVHPKRWALGYHTCPDCGEAAARAVRHTIVPMHKSNYTVITNRAELVRINNKG